MDRERFEIHAAHEVAHWWFTARRAILRRLLHRLVPPAREHLVVEVGCGTGGNTLAFARDYACLGIDPSADAIAIARERAAEASGPAVEFVQGFAPDDVREPLSRASVVLLLDVLEHVEDDFALVSKLLAATTPGTRFLVTVPAEERLWSSHDEVHAHYRRYDRERLAATWQGLPARCRLLSAMNTRLYPLVRLVRGVSRLRGRSLGPGGTDFTTPSWPVNTFFHGIFAGESRRLLRELETGEGTRRAGVSLVAVLERGQGHVAERTKPASVPLDLYDPVAGRMLRRGA